MTTAYQCSFVIVVGDGVVAVFIVADADVVISMLFAGCCCSYCFVVVVVVAVVINFLLKSCFL